jgi:hypothetical protein
MKEKAKKGNKEVKRQRKLGFNYSQLGFRTKQFGFRRLKK